MIPDYHTCERLAQIHSQELTRVAEHERLLAHLPRPGYKFQSFVQFLLSWRVIRTRWQKRFRRPIT